MNVVDKSVVKETCMLKNTIVISAYPACGKTYFYNNMNNKYSILDSDSSQFSWKMRKHTQEELDLMKEEWEKTPHLMASEGYLNHIKDEEIKVRDENFPNNYIEHIKENLGKVDIIFVSSHLVVRQAMKDANIPFFTIYPRQELLNEWVGRMYRRGNNEAFIKFQIDNWDKFTDRNRLEIEPHGLDFGLLDSNEYISEGIIDNWKKNFDYEIEEMIKAIGR